MLSTDSRAVLNELTEANAVWSLEVPSWEDVVARSRASTTIASLQRAATDGALVVDTATDAAADVWPADVLEAFRHLGHDSRYGTEAGAGLYGLFDQLNEDQIRGLTSSVKGTVLEIRVREMAEAGTLPGTEGLPRDAQLSESLTQTGHDVEILDSSGEVVDLLQVKAGTWSSVSGRIEEYAAQDIPVAVTSETAAAAEAAGWGDAVIDTGISGVELTQQVGDVMDNLGLGHAVDELVPELAVVAMAASVAMRLKAGQSPSEVREWATAELATLGVANAAGLALGLMTGVAAARPVAALGARWTMARVMTSSEVVTSVGHSRERLHQVKEQA